VSTITTLGPSDHITNAYIPASAAKKAQYEKQHDRAYKRIDDQSDDANAKINIQPREKPITDEGPQQSYYQIPNESKTGALHSPAGQPATRQLFPPE